MYRDDVCAVCGESLPPDHFYCRVHGEEVDERLHRIGAVLNRLRGDLADAGALLAEIAPETWDYLAEQEPDDPLWPPAPDVALKAAPEAVDVDVDTEPGYVRVGLGLDIRSLVTALADGLDGPDIRRFVRACAEASGANATH